MSPVSAPTMSVPTASSSTFPLPASAAAVANQPSVPTASGGPPGASSPPGSALLSGGFSFSDLLDSARTAPAEGQKTSTSASDTGQATDSSTRVSAAMADLASLLGVAAPVAPSVRATAAVDTPAAADASPMAGSATASAGATTAVDASPAAGSATAPAGTTTAANAHPAAQTVRKAENSSYPRIFGVASRVGEPAAAKTTGAAGSTANAATGSTAESATESVAAGSASGAGAAAAQTDTARTGTAASGAVPLSRVTETVAATVSTLSAKGLTQAKLSLTPDSLGNVKVVLTQTSQGLSARVVADRPEAAQTLLAGAEELRQRMESNGTPLLRLEIGTGDQSPATTTGDGSERRDATASNGGGDSTSTGRDGTRDSRRKTPDADDEPAETTRQLTVTLGDGSMVNVLA